jgi:hypothetical protein
LLLLSTAGSRHVKARAGMQTLVGYQHTGPAPWPDGNCLNMIPASKWSLYLARLQNTSWWGKYLSPLGNRTGQSEGFRVVNMHAENFHAVSQQLNLGLIEIEKLDDRFCLVVDRRIPKEWLLATPKTCCPPMAMRLKLWRERPECFREDAQLQSLFGKTWVNMELDRSLLGNPLEQTDREDAAELMARLLPGDRIRFKPAQLICTTASGEMVAERYWEPHERSFSATQFISIYEMREEGFSGMGMELDRDGDTLILILTSILERSEAGGPPERVPETEEGRPFQFRYRMESAGEE